MPQFRVNVKQTTKGILFDQGATKAAAARAVIRINDAIATEGVRRVQARLDQVLVNPTGYYRSRVTVERRSVYRGISDSNVVYGGYLEGVARNNKTTRFKGYHTFRKIRQELAQDKEKIAAPIVAALAKELRG